MRTLFSREVDYSLLHLETIDTAFYNFLNDRLALSTDTPTGFRKVPIIWVSAERAHQIKNNPELRDDRGELIYPSYDNLQTVSSERPSIQGLVPSKLL